MRKFIRFVAGLLIIYGILQLVISFDPGIVKSINIPAPPPPATQPTPQTIQATCNGQPMSPGDVCDVYEMVDGASVLVRTDTYDERYAEAQAAAQAATQAAQAAQAAQQTAHDQAEALKQFALTFTRPNMYIYGILAIVIGFLILRTIKASSRYQERIRRYSPNPVPVRQAQISPSLSYTAPSSAYRWLRPNPASPSPTDAEFHNQRGNTLFDSKRYEEALAAFDLAISLDPSNLAYQNRRGVVLFNLKRYEEALAAFDQVIKLAPTTALYYDNRGNSLRELKRYEEAVAAFDQAIKLAPKNADYQNRQGVVLFNLKRYEEAVVAFDQAIKLAPINALFHDNQGNALYELKRYEEAVVSFDQAIKLAPTNAAYRSHRETALREWPSAAKLPQPIPAPPASFQMFTSSDKSFSFVYPGDWQQEAGPADVGTGFSFTRQDQQKFFTVTVVNLERCT